VTTRPEVIYNKSLIGGGQERRINHAPLHCPPQQEAYLPDKPKILKTIQLKTSVSHKKEYTLSRREKQL